MKAHPGDRPNGVGIQAIDFASFTIEASPRSAFVGQEVTFYINATSDIPSANLTFLIFFDAYYLPFVNNTASPQITLVTGNPGTIVQKFTYLAPGNFTDLASGRHYYWVKVWVQDNESATINKRIQYYVNYNTAPQIVSLTPQVSPDPGVPEDVSLQVKDDDNDVLTVSWDFGDGGTAVETLTYTINGTYSNQSHAWSPVMQPGIGDYWVNYTINVTVEDGQGHWTNGTIPVTMYIPPNRSPIPDLKVTTEFWEPLEPVPFEASARDLEGDGIYWYFVFGDGTTFTDYTGPSTANVTVWNNQTHAYDLIGGNTTSYNVTLYTTDGPADHNQSIGPVKVTVLTNHAPVLDPIGHSPQTLELNVTIGYLNVTFSVQTNDEDGDNLTITWNMDDGSALKVNTTTGFGVKTLRQWRNFTEPTHINMTVVVTDGREGHEVIRYLNTTLLSTNNPPMLTQAPTWVYASGDAARPNETIDIALKVSDAEFDDLTIVWDFGDQSDILVLRFSLTDYVDGNVTCNVTHTYTKVGTYKIRVWIADNQLGYGEHNVSIDAVLTVKLEEKREVIVWDLWDYTSLGLFLMIPAVIAIYSLLVFRRRRNLDKEGINWDEYKAKKDSGFEEEL